MQSWLWTSERAVSWRLPWVAPSLQRQLYDRILPASPRTNKCPAKQIWGQITQNLLAVHLPLQFSAYPSVRGLQQCMQSALLAWEPEWQESSTFNTVVGRSTCQFKFSGTEQLHAKPHDKTKLKQTSSTSYCQKSPLSHLYLLRRQLFHIEQRHLLGAWDVEFCS